jgi:hypothetical protein
MRIILIASLSSDLLLLIAQTYSPGFCCCTRVQGVVVNNAINPDVLLCLAMVTIMVSTLCVHVH